MKEKEIKMDAVAPERIKYLREYLRQRLEDGSDDDLFLEDGENRIIWVSRDDEVEILVITLQPGKIQVAS